MSLRPQWWVLSAIRDSCSTIVTAGSLYHLLAFADAVNGFVPLGSYNLGHLSRDNHYCVPVTDESQKTRTSNVRTLELFPVRFLKLLVFLIFLYFLHSRIVS